MEYYDYRTWIEWPEQDIRKYAQEIAAHHEPESGSAYSLTWRMLGRATGYPFPENEYLEYPSKTSAAKKLDYRSQGEDDEKIFARNQRFNQPFKSPTSRDRLKWEGVGRGLTRRNFLRTVVESKYSRRERLRARRKFGKRAFSVAAREAGMISDDALWVANCYPLGAGDWLLSTGERQPFEGLIWYSSQLNLALWNASAQAANGATQAAMWHAFRAGSLKAELEQRLAHAATFEKYQAVNSAQRDAGKSRKIVPDELRRDAYWRHRRMGAKKVEAGRLAGNELNLSEPSIRAAFPNARYPID